jgi:hypothetical protein
MPSSLSRIAAVGACLAAVAGAALLSDAAAAAGFHMTRDFSAGDDSGRAYGETCGGSKFGNWRWHATVGSGDLQATYRWIEPVGADGKARNLQFTFIGGPAVEDQPEALQPMFVASVKRVLNRITVRSVGGGTKLAYTTPTGGKSTIPFRPSRGC